MGVDRADSIAKLPGSIVWIASAAEFTPTPIQTRDERADQVYAVKIMVPNKEGRLRIGMPGELVDRRRRGRRNEPTVMRWRFGASSAGSATTPRCRTSRSTCRLGRALRRDRSRRLRQDHAFRILVTLLLPDAGTAHVLGRDVVKDLVGPADPDRVHARTLLALSRSQCRGEPGVLRLPVRHDDRGGARDHRADLGPARAVRRPSRRRALRWHETEARALLRPGAPPEILFLDEPTTGVDAVSRKEFWDLLGRLRDRGCRSSYPRRTWTRPVCVTG